jgi:DNA-binding winged helix-turn-helix (wHTH) protein/tRNA A-37 threonylcarbamoyl transferase component Bud32
LSQLGIGQEGAVQGDFRIGEWLVHPQLNEIEREGEIRHLEPRVMDVLVYFASHAGEVLTKEQLIHTVWPDTFVTDDALKYSIGELRKALGDDAKNPTFLETIPRRGYRLIAPVVQETELAQSRYQVLESIGRGAMGEVVLAEDRLLRRKVALKFLLPELKKDETAHKRFLWEARSAAALDHPCVCGIHDMGELGGRTYIAMEYVDGQTLQAKLAEGPLPLAEGLKVATDVAEALEKAHKSGIVHRDLKPSNIMLTAEGQAKVMDFGLAKRVVTEDETEQDITSALTREGTTFGTLAYMSPEQLKAEPLDQRSDLFTFGIVLYEMLTGVHPFRKAKQAETTATILQAEPALLSRYIGEVPDLLEHIARKMLARDPNERYQSAHEVRTDLVRLVQPNLEGTRGERK